MNGYEWFNISFSMIYFVLDFQVILAKIFVRWLLIQDQVN